MRIFPKKNLLSATAVAAVICTPSAFATNGYFAHGYSMSEKGIVGAGVAMPMDSLAAASNPAGMVMVGNRMDAGIALFSPRREYESEGGPSGGPAFSVGPQSIESDANYFLIPSFGWNKMLDANSAIGVSVYGNGGMNTRYVGGTATTAFGPAPGTYGGGFAGNSTAGVDLSQLFAVVTYSRKLNDSNAIGISGIFAYQQFEARGLGAFALFGASTNGSKLSDNGHDRSTGFGAKIGWLGQITPALALGASYQSRIYMSEFDEYKGLFAEKGDFDIPPTATIGMSLKTSEKTMLALDVQRIWYSDIDAVGNPFSNIFNCPAFGGSDASSCLGGSNGAGFGWDDMTVVKIGFQWQTSPEMTWRVGYSRGDQPIPSSEVLFNILAPAVIEDHVTFGFTRAMGKDSELIFAAMYAPTGKVSGPNPLDPAQKITLEMDQYEFGVAWGWKF